MSAFGMKCQRCGGKFVAGVVGVTPWPAHVCPDGTENAAAEMDDWMTRPMHEKSWLTEPTKEAADA